MECAIKNLVGLNGKLCAILVQESLNKKKREDALSSFLVMNSKARGLSIGLLHILHKIIHWVWCCIVQSKFVQMCPMWPLKISKLYMQSFSGKGVAARLNPGLELTHLVPY